MRTPLPVRRPLGSRRRVLSALLVLALIGVVLFAGACFYNFDTSTTETRLQSGEKPNFQATLKADAASAAPGQQVSRTLGYKGTIPSGPVTFTWTPPPGAYDFIFDRPPDNSTPPFTWAGFGVGVTNTVRFRTPSLPPKSVYVESFQVRHPLGSASTAILRTQGWVTHTLQGAMTALPLAARPADEAPAAVGVAPLWFVDHVTFPQGVTLTQSLCQEWAALVKSDHAFIALRAPVSPTAAITEGYLSPVVFNFNPLGDNYVRLLNGDTWVPIFRVPLELRTDRLSFLENTLPSAPGEAWIALGGVSVTTNCPADLNLSSWAFEARGKLDLSFLPDYGAGRTLPLYYCYEGQEVPPVFAALSGVDMAAYQGNGITCLGPQALQLINTGQPPLLWDLRGTTSTWVTPTQSLRFRHQVAPGQVAPFTIDVTYTSSLAVPWGLYGGDWNAPNLSDPLTPPLLVTGFKDLWLVSDPVPAGTAHGEYSLVITATNVLTPTDLRWASDIIWVGDWVAPPTSPVYRLYLPLVLKT